MAKPQAKKKAVPAKKAAPVKKAIVVKKGSKSVPAAPKKTTKTAVSKPAKPQLSTTKKAVSVTKTLKSTPAATKPAPAAAVKVKKEYKPAKLPAGYKPLASEEYMNPLQQEYFRQKLLAWRKELMDESRETLDHLHEENWHQADIADRAALETEAGVELRTRNRYLKLVSKIDEAIRRIEQDDYGFCEETGEPIGLKRLEARPVATLSIEAQERHEKIEKQYIDED